MLAYTVGSLAKNSVEYQTNITRSIEICSICRIALCLRAAPGNPKAGAWPSIKCFTVNARTQDVSKSSYKVLLARCPLYCFSKHETGHIDFPRE